MIEVIISILVITVITLVVKYIRDVNRKNRSKISFKESLDLAELPVVTFYNGVKKINLLLDTGSNISYINSPVLKDLIYYESEGVQSSMGIDGNIINNQVCQIPIDYKDQKFVEEFTIRDMSLAFDEVKKESGVQIHGILGSRFFEKYRYVIDFKDLIAYIR